MGDPLSTQVDWSGQSKATFVPDSETVIAPIVSGTANVEIVNEVVSKGPEPWMFFA